MPDAVATGLADLDESEAPETAEAVFTQLGG
jgi:hypothetical protein